MAMDQKWKNDKMCDTMYTQYLLSKMYGMWMEDDLKKNGQDPGSTDQGRTAVRSDVLPKQPALRAAMQAAQAEWRADKRRQLDGNVVRFH